MKNEIWKIISDFDLYEISNIGRVRRRVASCTSRAGHIMKLTLKRGYYVVSLTDNKKRQKQFLVNRLVCEAFNGLPPSPNHQAAHENGITTVNTPENLSWKTNQENVDDRRRHGTNAIGERNGNVKLTEQQVVEIRKRYASGDISYKKLAIEYNVTNVMISLIIRNRNWQHI